MSHLSSLMDDVGVQQQRVQEEIVQKTQKSSSNSFGPSRLTCFCSSHFIRCLLREGFLYGCMSDAVLLDCSSEANSERVSVPVFVRSFFS